MSYVPVYYWWEARWEYFDSLIKVKYPVPNPYILTYNILWEKIHALASFTLSSAIVLAIRPYHSLKQYVLSIEKNLISRSFIACWLYVSADAWDRVNHIWWLSDFDIFIYLWNIYYIINTIVIRIKKQHDPR